ncbi:FecR family protein [Dyadobacter tibetensis]|uniref:FecR family protein n=1 Tax=Dyadobacter tibetensis TaxID=1211851 RepID=UPI000470808E|nr:FecR family protein [Dyadobacter tibetensis]
MKKYEKYGVEDFIQDEEFRSWVLGSSQYELLWFNFIRNYPEKREELEEAERWIRASRVSEAPISKQEIRSEVQRFLNRAQDGVSHFNEVGRNESVLIKTNEKPSHIWFHAAAASLIILTGLIIGNHYYRMPSPAKVNNLVETFNHTGKPLPIFLADSSVVVLSANSALRYPSRFTDSARIVYLKGEASFSVAHQGQPFLVFSGEMITRVLGTKFVVNAFENHKKYTVQVLSGKVSVYQGKEGGRNPDLASKGLILTANQAAIYERQDQQLFKTIIADPQALDERLKLKDRTYDEVPLPKLFEDLEALYGITILFDTAAFRKCRITATLSTEPLFEQLKAVCKTVSATYEIVDGQIVINGKGC